LLAVRTDATVLPSFSVPQADGSYRVFYGPPLETERTGDRERDAAAVTADCTAVIERWIREHPELWLWMHRRFKTVPPPDPEG
jgi:KDO2-lipid IV(A) lauroyltransferase